MQREEMGDADPGEATAGSGNRLAREKSPYLLQHAKNPVNWFPWGEEAFLRASREDKPVFLSIGYATCHWCHVMAHESFEDLEVAEALNRDFVCIKVDREERPDIDSTYMQACQLMTGQGGWPLTIIMTPEKNPFFAATYLPKERRFALFGLLDLLPRVARAWRDQREELLTSSDRIARAIRQSGDSGPGDDPDLLLLDEGYESLVLQFDPTFGGFGGAPKFPTPHLLLFLLRYGKRTGKLRAREMVEKTLDAMRDGGIYDQIGGGFHRYSTDAQWRVPHFEKMLYDQALLLMAYTEAFQATGNERFRETAREIVTYVFRDLTSGEGVFLSAEDADSPGGEGAFYLWTMEELAETLGPDDGRIAALTYGIYPGRDREPDSTHGIMHRALPRKTLAASLAMTENELGVREESLRARLLTARGQRPRPRCDDKVLADWNGLFIAALAKSARVFGKNDYTAAAIRAVTVLLARMRTGDGMLLHRYREGEAAIPGFADDYAFLLLALLELYETTFDVGYLAQARALARTFVARFLDPAGGGFFSTGAGAEDLLGRRKEIYDGAVPSANSVACDVFLRLASLPGDPEYAGHAASLSRCFTARVRANPAAHGWFLCAIERALGPEQNIVIAGVLKSPDTDEMIAIVRSRYLPSSTVMFCSTSGEREERARLSDLAPFTRDLTSQGGRTTAYLCSGSACSVPVTDPVVLGTILDGRKKGT